MADRSRVFILLVIGACFTAAIAERAGTPHFPTTITLLTIVLAGFIWWSRGERRG